MMVVILATGLMLALADLSAAIPTPRVKNQTDNDNSTDDQGRLSDSELPWWSTDEMINNVFPWSNYHQSAADQRYGNEDKYFMLRTRDGKDGPMKHIMRILSFLPPTEEQLKAYRKFTPPPGAGRSANEVCPLFVEPLYEYGQYRPCSPRNATACPNAYACELSPVLGAHLCCREISYHQIPLGQGNYFATTLPSERTRNPWEPAGRWQALAATQPASLQPGSVRGSWVHSIGPIEGPHGVNEPHETRPNWAPQQLNQKQEMLTTESAAVATTPRLHTSTADVIPAPNSTAFPSSPVISTSTIAIATTAASAPLNITDTVSVNGSADLLSLITTMHPSSVSHAPKQAIEQLISTPLPGNANGSPVQVVQLTAGSLKTLSNGDVEYASTMTLIKDGDKHILVDTGLPTDTNTLIRGN